MGLLHVVSGVDGLIQQGRILYFFTLAEFAGERGSNPLNTAPLNSLSTPAGISPASLLSLPGA
jgi:hypothetical protein